MSVCTDQSVVFNYFLYMTREVELTSSVLDRRFKSETKDYEIGIYC